MKCPKCNKEFSEPVLELHVQRCQSSEKIESKKEIKSSKKGDKNG